MIRRSATLLGLMSLLAACSTAPGLAPVTGSAGAGAASGTIEVINRSAHSLDNVTISPCGGPASTINRLPAGQTIPVGSNHLFPVTPGCWDVDGGATGVGVARQRLTVPVGGLARYTIDG